MWISIVFTRRPRSYTKYFYEPNYNVLNDFNSQSYEPLHKFQWIIPMDYTNASPYNLLVILIIYLPHSSPLNLENKWNGKKSKCNCSCKMFNHKYYSFDRVAMHSLCIVNCGKLERLGLVKFTATIFFILKYIYTCWIRFSTCCPWTQSCNQTFLFWRYINKFIELIWECVHFKIISFNFISDLTWNKIFRNIIKSTLKFHVAFSVLLLVFPVELF